MRGYNLFDVFNFADSGILYIKSAENATDIWNQTDSCYQKAVLADDATKMLGLENCFCRTAPANLTSIIQNIKIFILRME